MNEQHAGEQQESLWTVRQTASYLQMSESWVYRHTESGELPAARLGGVLRFLPARVREYAEKRMAGSPAGGNVVHLPRARR